MRVDKIAHVQIVAVGGRVLKVGERVDAPRKRRVPGGVREPDGGRERALRGRVPVVGHDQEHDVLVLPVGVLQRFQRQKLRIVLVEEDPVVGGEFEERDSARRAGNQDQRGQDDQPAGREHAFGESCRELPRCHAAPVHWREARANSQGPETFGRSW